jgi:hypothetical protein
MRRRRPVVLGDDYRKGAYLPVDRWMLARLHAEGPRARKHIAPVAWQGKFETSPLAEPAFAATPSSAATPLTPPPAIEPAPEPLFADAVEPEAAQTQAATVDALTLDAYTRRAPQTVDDEVPHATEAAEAVEPVVAAVAVPQAVRDADVEDVSDIAFVDPSPPIAHALEPRPVVPTRPALPRTVPHDELDPEVRAIVDDLYEQARQELSGNNDMAFFAPFDDRNPLVDIVQYEPPAVHAEPELDSVIVDTMNPLPPVAAEAPAREAKTNDARQSRRGWQPAFVADDTRRRNLSE